MSLPKKYAWLKQETGPKMILEGLKLYGTKEIVGPKHNEVIMGWASFLGIGNIYKNDETAWCGLAHAVVIVRSGKPLRLKGYDILRALKYAEFGTAVPLHKAMFGDTLVFKRPSGGHVGLYIAESDNTFHVMGGNQSNAYNIIEIEKSRCVAVRRPEWQIKKPDSVRKIYMDSTGVISKNEA